MTDISLNALGFSHQFISAYVKEGDLVIDATAGRGRDTAFLAELVGENGRVIAFDIQQEAVDSTLELLEKKGLSKRAEVFCDSHENMLSYAEKGSVRAVMFNFGWLPGGDHNIFSHGETSINAIKSAMELICDGGVISLCIYCGKECGYEEKNEILEFLKTVDSKLFTVCVTDFVNRTGDFPIPAFIIKRT